MAETVVLANVTIDSSGVVKGAGKANAALAGTEKGVDKLAKQNKAATGAAQG